MPRTPAEPNEQPLPPAYNRDDEMRPGRPPQTAYVPDGAEGSSRNAKTLTDPASGEPQPGAPAPAKSGADETDVLKDQ